MINKALKPGLTAMVDAMATLLKRRVSSTERRQDHH